MGTLTGDVISTTYKNLLFTKSSNDKIYYTNGSDLDTEITTFDSAFTLSGLITASAGIKLGNNVIKASDGATAITTTATSGNVAINGDLTVTGNDIKSSGATAITMSGANVTIAGDLTITGGNITNAITCDSTVTTTGLLTASANIVIGPDSDADRSIVFGHATLKTIMGIYDDQNVFAINTDAAFEAANDFELDASGNATIKGDLTISGGNIINALTLDSTLAVSGNTTITGNLTFVGDRDIVFTQGDGLEIKDADSTYITMVDNTVTVTPESTFTGKTTFNGGSVTPVKAFSSNANGDLEIAESGKYVLINNSMSGGKYIQLPQASTASGVNYKFRLTVDLAGALEIKSHAVDELIIGGVTWIDSNSDIQSDAMDIQSLAAGAKEEITLAATTKAGTWIEVVCDGAEWYINGTVYAEDTPSFTEF